MGTKSINANGTYNASSDGKDGYSQVTVNVPNSYAAGDEGKVVSNGALVAQTARPSQITANGIYDTTLNDEVEVAVSGASATLGTKSIVANGSYSASSDSLDGYSSVSVEVPNSYSASDEGKVVSSGALVSQTARASSITQNGTYDTTLNDSVTVSVAGGGGGDDGLIALFQGTGSVLSGSNLSVVADYAACMNNRLTGVYLGEAVTIGSSAFQSCTSLSEVSLPECTEIGNNAFDHCTALLSMSLPKCETLGFKAIGHANNLSEVLLPECTTVASQAFLSCANIEAVSLPKAVYVNDSAFQSCASLSEISLPECIRIGSNVFGSCVNLETASLPKITSISSSAFVNCKKLMSLYVPVDSVPTLGISAFHSTPIANSSYTGSFGSIFVLSSLYSAFVAAKNWSAYASRITSYVEE